VYPRIITPNNDGWNDKAIFQFDNVQLLPLTGKIYDITGRLLPISSLAQAGYQSGMDGKGSGVRGREDIPLPD